MIGLIQKNLQAGYVTVFMITFVFALAAVAGFIIRTPGAHMIATFAIGGAFATNLVTHFHRKDDVNWQLLETTMPIKLAFVELSRYLAFLVVFALIVMATAVYTLTNYLGGISGSAYDAAMGFVSSVIFVACFYFMFAAILFPMLRAFSAKNSVGVVYGCFVGTLVLFFVIMQISSQLPQSLQNIGNWPFAATSVSLFVLSYFVSVRLYRRRCAV